ncbi:MAG: beta-lactamase family protein [Sphingomonadales bacterium]|nr:beta-lactamase family protein [Sphingomonadales bacterium]
MLKKHLLVALGLAGMACPVVAVADGYGGEVSGIGRLPVSSLASSAHPDGLAWPVRAWPRAEPGDDVAKEQLMAAVDALASPESVVQGRVNALILVHRGQIVVERYGEGVTAGTPLYTGSIAKFFNNAVAGVMTRRGMLDVTEPAGAPEWRAPGDPRQAITFEHLLQMRSGLRWDEEYMNPNSNAFRGYFGEGYSDVAAYVARQPLDYTPGEVQEYSSGTSTLLARQMMRKAGGKDAYLALFGQEIAKPLGITSYVLEFDLAGSPQAGMYSYISGQDLARLTYLYLRDGMWDGARILPKGWVDWSRTTPNARASVGERDVQYGAQVQTAFTSLGEDVFGHSGVGTQFAFAFPERDLVMVILSSLYDFPPNTSAAQMVPHLFGLIQAFPKDGTPYGQ